LLKFDNFNVYHHGSDFHARLRSQQIIESRLNFHRSSIFCLISAAVHWDMKQPPTSSGTVVDNYFIVTISTVTGLSFLPRTFLATGLCTTHNNFIISKNNQAFSSFPIRCAQ